jgi:hypothetical protein
VTQNAKPLLFKMVTEAKKQISFLESYMFRVHGDSAAVNRPSLKTVMRLPAQNSHG